MNRERILVTCALPYVNNVPHIGNIVGSHLPADIFARFCRLLGHEIIFIGGSDEHGTPIEVAAEKLGVTPKELCDKYYEVHKKIYEWLDISYDNFSRTSIEIHHETTKDFFIKIYEHGYVSEGVLRLPYCKKCSRFLPDRYVKGICPRCGYENARGDQCERCSFLLNPDELIDAKCIICGEKPIIKESKHLFLNLDKLQPKLKKWIESKRGIWSPQVYNMAMGWIKEGLKPRCITRDIKWGVKVPLKGYEDKVFYVWFDAPIGYISSTKEWAEKIGKPEEWKKFWKEKCKIYHFIGKDNIPFHTIFWPAMLLANGEYLLPYRVAGLQYLNYEGDKISKSKGWGIFCENLPKTNLSSDVWRFYLTLLIPETSDTEWKWSEFQERVNKELVANLGNFIYRTMSFIVNNFNGEVPEPNLSEKDREMLRLSEKYAEEIKSLIMDIKLKEALKKILELSDKGNKYFQEQEPWKNKKTAATTLYVCANLCYDLAILLSPFMPKSAKKICKQLDAELGKFQDIGKEKIKPGQKLKKVKPLFPKLTDDTIQKIKKITTKITSYDDFFMKKIDFSEFKKYNLVIAEILEVSSTENEKKLKLKIGNEIYEIKVDKGISANKNMKIAVLMEEKPKILLAKEKEKISLITVDREIKSGSKIR